MPFQKGHKLAKGGKREGAGRKTKAELQVKQSFLDRLIAEREEQAEILAGSYYRMALEDPATMRHLVDKVLASAKQEIGITQNVAIDRESIKELMQTKEGREAAEAVVKALAARRGNGRSAGA